MRYLALGVLAIISAMMMLGCAGGEESLAEREIERRAPELIAPADNYDADVRGLTQDRAEQVIITGTRVRPEPNLVIDNLVLNLRDVRYQREPFRVTNVGTTTFSARMTDQALTSFLRTQPRVTEAGIQSLLVRFLQNQVQISALVPIANQSVNVTTVGTLQAAQGTRINYVPQTITVGGVTVPPDTMARVATAINPIADLSPLRFSPQIQQLTIAPGAMTVTGTATPVFPQ